MILTIGPIQMHAVYTITHPSTGVFYTGRTSDFNRRKLNHTSMLERGVHSNSNLQAAYNNNPHIEWEVTEVDGKEEAITIEKELIKIHGTSPLAANFHHLKTSEKVIASFSDERRESIRSRMTGTTHTEETLARMREVQKDSRPSDDALQLAAEVNKKSVTVDGIYYRTASEAAVALDCHVSTILNRVRNPRPKWDNWQLVEGNN